MAIKIGTLVEADLYLLWDYPEEIEGVPGVVTRIGTDYVLSDEEDEYGDRFEEVVDVFTVRWDDADYEAEFYEWDIYKVSHPTQMTNKEVAKYVLSNERGW